MAKDDWIDRSQGILTTTDRDVLLSGEQFEPRGREARSRIRRRLNDALLDYIILDRGLPQKDLDQLFEWEHTDPDSLVQQHVAEGLKAQVKFVYRAAKAGNLKPEQLINDAISEAKGTRIDQLAEQFRKNPESLTLNEISDLYQAGEIPEDEYEELFREALRAPAAGAASLDDVADFLGQRGQTEDEQ